MKASWRGVLVILMAGLLASCTSEQTEQEYFDLAYQYMAQQDWEQAEENFAAVCDRFPGGTHASKSLFMVGYINANHLNKLEKAEKFYNEFLEKYPDHELADDARYELDHLGKDVDELPFLQDEEEDSTVQGDAPAQP